jgi:uncharacterized protein (DUF1501 family)
MHAMDKADGRWTRRASLSLMGGAAAALWAGGARGAQNTLTNTASVAAGSARARAVIQIWLWGGASHLDTFDPKPEAGSDYAGPLGAIPTRVDGMRLCELMPKLAEQADKFSLIRGMTHGINAHETAAYVVQTGHPPGLIQYPGVGAVVSRYKGRDAGYRGELPPYIVLTELQGRFSECGFLGSRYKPFATGGDPSKTPFAVEGIVAEGITRPRQLARRELLGRLDTLGAALAGDSTAEAFRTARDGAYEMMLGEGAKVFDLAQETPAVRERYGMTQIGQSCLMARRLVERGVPYVTINFKGWDTHKAHFQAMRLKVPQLDRAVASLLEDLSASGLLASTIVWCGGEFGRTPRVQWEAPWNGGRSHYGRVFSSLVAGGGFRGGSIVGASDARGEEVSERPVYPWDLTGSLYQLLGIDPDGWLPHAEGQVARVTPVAGPGVICGGRLREIM